MCQLLRLGRIHKAQDFRQIAGVADQSSRARNHSTQERKNIDRKIASLFQRLLPRSAEQPGTLLFDVLYDKLPELVDDGNGVFIALSLSISPGEEAVTAEDDTVTIRTCLHCAAQHHGQFEAGALPWNPNQMVVKQTIEFFHPLPAVRRSSQSNTPVGMQVIDVRERQEPMQRRVDRGGNAILTECAERI